GTMNVYLGGAAKLAATLAGDGVLPAWLAGRGGQSVSRRPLFAVAVIARGGLLGLLVGIRTTTAPGPPTSAPFIAVYVLAIVSAIRILRGHARLAAIASLGGILGLAAFSTDFLAVPLVAAAIALVLRRAVRPHSRPIASKGVEQAQLHGLRGPLRDLGIPLISVNPDSGGVTPTKQRR